MIDLQLHQAADLAMALGRAPHHALGPDGVLAQLVDRGVVVVGHLIGERELARVEDPRLRAEEAQKARRFLDGEPGERADTQGTIEQQDPRRRILGADAGRGSLVDEPLIERGKVIRLGKRTQRHEISEAQARPARFAGRQHDAAAATAALQTSG
jgi:hypothetical protein